MVTFPSVLRTFVRTKERYPEPHHVQFVTYVTRNQTNLLQWVPRYILLFKEKSKVGKPANTARDFSRSGARLHKPEPCHHSGEYRFIVLRWQKWTLSEAISHQHCNLPSELYSKLSWLIHFKQVSSIRWHILDSAEDRSQWSWTTISFTYPATCTLRRTTINSVTVIETC